MSLPTFTTHHPSEPTSITMSPAAAAVALGMSRNTLRKLVDCGVIPTPIPAESIYSLARRPRLAVTAGELTVLRTSPKADAPDEDREHIGFHVDYDDHELEETSLRWWRADADRVCRNGLFAVTVATFPVAVFEITGVIDTIVRDDESEPRHHFEGNLIARLSSRRAAHGRTPLVGLATEDTVVSTGLDRGHPLLARAQKLMFSRIDVESGGPIGYLALRDL